MRTIHTRTVHAHRTGMQRREARAGSSARGATRRVIIRRQPTGTGAQWRIGARLVGECLISEGKVGHLRRAAPHRRQHQAQINSTGHRSKGRTRTHFEPKP
jgi:hypothetical protein